jgi:hypothetical protein
MPGQLVPSRLRADKKLAFKVEMVAELPRRSWIELVREDAHRNRDGDNCPSNVIADLRFSGSGGGLHARPLVKRFSGQSLVGFDEELAGPGQRFQCPRH